MEDHLTASNNYTIVNRHYFDKPLSIMMIVTLSPILLFNVCIALLMGKSPFFHQNKIDAFGRPVIIMYFRYGIIKQSALLFSVIQGNIAFCGVPLADKLTPALAIDINKKAQLMPGIFSLYDLHRCTGLSIDDPKTLLLQQLNFTTYEYVALIFKSMFCYCIYGQAQKNVKSPKQFKLFGLTINNASMAEVVDSIANEKQPNSLTKTNQKMTDIGFFINVNSINISVSNVAFYQTLQQANFLLADGSGMRLAAKSAGYEFEDNINGTDLLPHLCRKCIDESKSIYLLGSQPGVANQAALNLQNEFPQLRISGTHHGFIKPSELNEQIQKINQSGCDILLVAMGSPFQEQWLIDNRTKLNCQTALAVGGLFDFYSGDITRSPLWMRELGLEWIWRLWKQPIVKFKRYVIGNPLFLFRIYVLGLANKGVKS